MRCEDEGVRCADVDGVRCDVEVCVYCMHTLVDNTYVFRGREGSSGCKNCL